MADGEAAGKQCETPLEAEDRAGRELGVGAVQLRHGDGEQGEPAAAEQQRQPLPPLDRVAEDPLRHHRQQSPRRRRAPPARARSAPSRAPRRGSARPPRQGPSRPRTSASRPASGCSAAAGAGWTGVGLVTSPVLEQRGEVRHQRGDECECDADLHEAFPGPTAARRRRAPVATAEAEVWQALAIALSARSGARRTSNSSRPARRTLTRDVVAAVGRRRVQRRLARPAPAGR